MSGHAIVAAAVAAAAAAGEAARDAADAAALAAARAHPHAAASYALLHPATAASASKFLGQNILLLLAQNGYGAAAARCLSLCRDTRENLELWDWAIDEPYGEDKMTRLMHWAGRGDLAHVCLLYTSPSPRDS